MTVAPCNPPRIALVALALVPDIIHYPVVDLAKDPTALLVYSSHLQPAWFCMQGGSAFVGGYAIMSVAMVGSYVGGLWDYECCDGRILRRGL